MSDNLRFKLGYLTLLTWIAMGAMSEAATSRSTTVTTSLPSLGVLERSVAINVHMPVEELSSYNVMST